MTELVGRARVENEFRFRSTSREFFDVMVGDHIGSGAFREVFHMRNDPTVVIKFEMTAQSFHNVFEWQLWQRLVSLKNPLKVWLAPCIDISASGGVLLQRFAEDILDTELPSKVPSFFTDMAPRNWGRYKKKIVCRDYGSTKLIDVACTDTEMRDANWRLKASKVRNP